MGMLSQPSDEVTRNEPGLKASQVEHITEMVTAESSIVAVAAEGDPNYDFIS